MSFILHQWACDKIVHFTSAACLKATDWKKHSLQNVNLGFLLFYNLRAVRCNFLRNINKGDKSNGRKRSTHRNEGDEASILGEIHVIKKVYE